VIRVAAETASTARRIVIELLGSGAPAPPASPARSSGSSRCRRPEPVSAVLSASTPFTAASVAAACFLYSALQVRSVLAVRTRALARSLNSLVFVRFVALAGS